MAEPATSSPPADAPSAIASPAAPAPSASAGDAPPSRWRFASIFALRRTIPLWAQAVLGILCVTLCLLGWWRVTRGDYEHRIIGYYALPSPRETFEAFADLWFDEE